MLYCTMHCCLLGVSLGALYGPLALSPFSTNAVITRPPGRQRCLLCESLSTSWRSPPSNGERICALSKRICLRCSLGLSSVHAELLNRFSIKSIFWEDLGCETSNFDTGVNNNAHTLSNISHLRFSCFMQKHNIMFSIQCLHSNRCLCGCIC